MAQATKSQITAPVLKQGQVYLTDRQTGARYGVHRNTPHRWAREGKFPKPVKLGPNCTRFRLADLEAWEAQREEGA